MIKKSLIHLIYEAASIHRWNDHIRPWTGFSELDKQAHKMFYAYVLARCENGQCDLRLLIEGGIFEFLHRIILTDIKPPIYHKLMENKGASINAWILEQLRPNAEPLGGGFYERMVRYFTKEDYAEKEKRILRAAHFLATDWEFRVIYPLNSMTYGIEQVKNEVGAGLASCDTFDGFRYFMSSSYLQDFMSLISRLRYQQRWSRASCMPQTYVMGHMLIVAVLSYFCSLELGACDKRAVNNFFGGLFHDLPEVLTRDIVSPIKASVEGLDNIIKDIEQEQMEKSIYPLLPAAWHQELKYFTNDEFCSKIYLERIVTVVTSDEINERYNDDKFNPIDGQIIRGCDHISAYVEAYLSLTNGIQSEQLQSGHKNLYDRYCGKTIGGIDFGQIFEQFHSLRQEER